MKPRRIIPEPSSRPIVKIEIPQELDLDVLFHSIGASAFFELCKILIPLNRQLQMDWKEISDSLKQAKQDDDTWNINLEVNRSWGLYLYKDRIYPITPGICFQFDSSMFEKLDENKIDNIPDVGMLYQPKRTPMNIAWRCIDFSKTPPVKLLLIGVDKFSVTKILNYYGFNNIDVIDCPKERSEEEDALFQREPEGLYHTIHATDLEFFDFIFRGGGIPSCVEKLIWNQLSYPMLQAKGNPSISYVAKHSHLFGAK